MDKILAARQAYAHDLNEVKISSHAPFPSLASTDCPLYKDKLMKKEDVNNMPGLPYGQHLMVVLVPPTPLLMGQWQCNLALP